MSFLLAPLRLNLRLAGASLRGFSSQLQNSQIEIPQNFVNRNPRNLERLRIAYKPDGYHVERPGRSFWHKVKLSVSGRYVTATVCHFENGVVLKASTSEWALKKQLYRYKDTCAFANLGKVLADRCIKAGLNEVLCDITPPKVDGKIARFLGALQEGGLILQEPTQFKAAQPWDLHRPEKPWEITE